MSSRCAETASDALTTQGHVPFAYVTPAASQEAQKADVATLLREINVHVRRDIGSIATVSGLVKGRLPKTVRLSCCWRS